MYDGAPIGTVLSSKSTVSVCASIWFDMLYGPLCDVSVEGVKEPKNDGTLLW